MAVNPDLGRIFEGDTASATRHYVEYGFREGRLTGGLLAEPADSALLSIGI